MCTSSSSGCSVLGMVGDSEEELWTETASFASSSAIVASVAAGEDSGCPSCTSCSSFSVSRSETERTSGVEANNSHALQGLVAVAGPVRIRGHRGLAALSMRHKSTLGAMLRKCNLVHCVVHPYLALVDSAESFLRCTFSLAKAIVEESPTSWLLPICYDQPLRLKRSINCITIDKVWGPASSSSPFAWCPNDMYL